MKWYFASNSLSKDYYPLIKAAVSSAIKNTTLEPYFIYDGNPDELTEWLENQGVKIVYHRISFYKDLKEYYSEEDLIVASGAFLRCDIPILEQDEEYILYTDCDVIFLKDVEMRKPEFISCATETHADDWENFNTGVMFMNIKNLRESYDYFCNFIKSNLPNLYTYDQTAFQFYYGDKKNTHLDLKYNHKPYWGKNNDAVIVHFHGSKPMAYTSEKAIKNRDHLFKVLYSFSPEGYDYYLAEFKKYYPSIEYDFKSIKKLKKELKNPLSIRIKNFVRKNILHKK